MIRSIKVLRSKAFSSAVVAFLFLNRSMMVAEGSPKYEPADHLLPADPEILGNKYVAILKEKLCVTPFDEGRVLILPAFAGEESLSVYSQRRDKGHQLHYVTYLAASENLSDRTGSGRYPQEAKNVRIRRIDAEIPERTAKLVKRGWFEALAHTRPLSKSERALELVFTDAAEAQFSLSEPHRTLSGRTVMAPGRLGRRMNELVAITDLLRAYCKSKPADRPVIAAKIESESTRALKLLMQTR